MGRSPLQSILYVEDNPNIRALAKIALERIGGFSTHAFDSGAEALAAVQSGLVPDLLLLDVMLPGMDGPTILQRLRDIPSTAATPAVFMTAKAQSAEIAHFMSLGALGVITKPFQPTTLSKDILRLWNGQPPDATTPSGDDAIAEFRARFVAGLPKQLAALKAHALQLAAGTDDQTISAAHHLLHVISGNAGTFGYGEVGNRARRVEELIRTSQSAGGAKAAAIGPALDEFLQWCDASLALNTGAQASAPSPAPD